MQTTQHPDQLFDVSQPSYDALKKRKQREKLKAMIGKDVKPFKCSLCAKIYSRDDNLKRHMKADHATHDISVNMATSIAIQTDITTSQFDPYCQLSFSVSIQPEVQDIRDISMHDDDGIDEDVRHICPPICQQIGAQIQTNQHHPIQSDSQKPEKDNLKQKEISSEIRFNVNQMELELQPNPQRDFYQAPRFRSRYFQRLNLKRPKEKGQYALDKKCYIYTNARCTNLHEPPKYFKPGDLGKHMGIFKYDTLRHRRLVGTAKIKSIEESLGTQKLIPFTVPFFKQAPILTDRERFNEWRQMYSDRKFYEITDACVEMENEASSDSESEYSATTMVPICKQIIDMPSDISKMICSMLLLIKDLRSASKQVQEKLDEYQAEDFIANTMRDCIATYLNRLKKKRATFLKLTFAHRVTTLTKIDLSPYVFKESLQHFTKKDLRYTAIPALQSETTKKPLEPKYKKLIEFKYDFQKMLQIVEDLVNILIQHDAVGLSLYKNAWIKADQGANEGKYIWKGQHIKWQAFGQSTIEYKLQQCYQQLLLLNEASCYIVIPFWMLSQPTISDQQSIIVQNYEMYGAQLEEILFKIDKYSAPQMIKYFGQDMVDKLQEQVHRQVILFQLTDGRQMIRDFK